jgi:iron complex transport system permease protein
VKHRTLYRNLGWLLLLCAASLLIGIFSLCVGSSGVPIAKIPTILLHGRDSIEYTILMDVRLPRILLGLAVGGSLSLAGVLLQGMFRNPLVEPYTLGISGGAAVGVCLAIAWKLGASLGVLALPVSGFLGAAAAIVAVYFLGTRKYVLNVRDLLLTGVMISFVSSSVVMFVLAVARAEDLHGIIFWIMGSLDQSNPLLIKIAAAVSILSLVIAYLFCLDLNALNLGEEQAMHLGVSVENTKRILFLLASVTTGISVSVAGVIGFVGLVIPHLARLLLGSDHRIILAASWIGGGAFLVLCDTLARTVISPLELPVGVITGILGGSIFVYALSRHPLQGGK